MNKKTLIQVLMILLIILISVWFYLKYFNTSPKILEGDAPIEKIDPSKKISSTYMDNVNYVSSDSKGNKYEINAEQAEIKKENPDVMFLKNVTAYIFVKDSDTIKVNSDFGEYNLNNYDTIFSKNVLIDYLGNKVTGEYLDFSFLNNLGIMSKNVIYYGDETKLFADKIEIDLITKDTKIFMDDRNKKVLIEGNK